MQKLIVIYTLNLNKYLFLQILIILIIISYSNLMNLKN